MCSKPRRTSLETACALAASGGRGCRANLVGRNAQATEALIAECRQICLQAELVFVRANDLSLVRDVAAACSEISRLERLHDANYPRVDYLILCQGGALMKSRQGV